MVHKLLVEKHHRLVCAKSSLSALDVFKVIDQKDTITDWTKLTRIVCNLVTVILCLNAPQHYLSRAFLMTSDLTKFRC
jgi:hypothetical protein